LCAKSDVLVIGGCGFIGWNLVEYLASRKDQVAVLDSRKLPNISPEVTLIEGSPLDLPPLQESVKGKELIFHISGSRGVKASQVDPIDDARDNILGTLNVLETVRKYNDSCRILLVSSSAVYGESLMPNVKESDPVAPINPYGASKASAEVYGEMYSRIYGMKIVRIRQFNTYGSFRSHSKDIISVMIRNVLSNRPPSIDGTGEQVRDFTHIKDVVRIMNLAINETRAYGKVLNVGRGEGIRIIDLASLIIQIFDPLGNLSPVFSRESSGGHGNVSNNSLLIQLLNTAPEIDISTGLRMIHKEMSQSRPSSNQE